MDSHFMNPERVRRYLNSKLVRGIFRWVSEPTKDGEVKLEKILTHYGKSKRDLSWRERISFLPVYLAIEVLRLILHWKREYLIKEIFGLRNIRRATINLARSVAEYGATRPQNFASPLLVVWNFTNLCNLRCRHCYQNAGKRGKQLSLPERLRVIDELDANFVPTLAFSGGEPLCDPDFFIVARYAASREIYLSVATNGVLLSEDMGKKLKDSGIGYVEISLDSSYPEYHDNFRGLPGVWEKTIEGIKNAVKAGLLVGIAPTLTRGNLKDLPSLYRLTQELGVKRFYIFNFIPTGRAREILAEDLSPEEREGMLEFLYQCLMEKKIFVFSTTPQLGRKCLEKNPEGMVITGHYSVSEGKLAQVAAEYVGGCGAGRAYCALQPNGVVSPCVFIPIAVGNIIEQPFSQIWRESSVLRELRDRTLYRGHCGKCDYRSVCGGCRARAYAYFKDYLAPDPGCKFNQEFWEAIEKETITQILV